MRLLHVSASYLPATRYGGPIASVHRLCAALAARGHDVHVFTTSVNGPDDSAVPHEAATILDGVTVWYFRSQFARRLYWAPGMARALDRHVGGFDVVHTHAVFLWPMWAAAARAYRHGVPYVMSPRGMLEKDLIEKKSTAAKSVLIAFREKWFLEHAAAVHVTSAREGDELRKFGFDLPPVYEVPNGADVEAAPAGSPSPAIADAIGRGPFALFLGRISWKKGLDRLVAALSEAPAVRVIVAGPDEGGYRAVIEAQARQAGVAERMVFVDDVHGADKQALLASAMFLVLPSYSENFGNVVLESFAQARPVIVTPEVGLADCVAASQAGLVASGAPVELAAALRRLADDRERRAAMGANGRALLDRQFRWPAVAARMEHLYNGLTARP